MAMFCPLAMLAIASPELSVAQLENKVTSTGSTLEAHPPPSNATNKATLAALTNLAVKKSGRVAQAHYSVSDGAQLKNVVTSKNSPLKAVRKNVTKSGNTALKNIAKGVLKATKTNIGTNSTIELGDTYDNQDSTTIPDGCYTVPANMFDCTELGAGYTCNGSFTFSDSGTTLVYHGSVHGENGQKSCSHTWDAKPLVYDGDYVSWWGSYITDIVYDEYTGHSTCSYSTGPGEFQFSFAINSQGSIVLDDYYVLPSTDCPTPWWVWLLVGLGSAAGICLLCRIGAFFHKRAKISNSGSGALLRHS